MGLIASRLLLLLLGGVGMVVSGEKTLFDFEAGRSESPWYIVNDGVMGGLSQSEMGAKDGAACFRGILSLENNGGFASVRTEVVSEDLAGFDGFRLRVKGDGKVYKFRVRTTQRFDGVAYSVNFPTQAGEWQTHRLAADQFVPMFRGRIVRSAPPLDMALVRQLGFLISDKQVGTFELHVDSIAIYREP